MTETRSTCPYCGVGCGVVIQSQGGRITGVRGDPDHPANFGRLCTKGSTLHLTATAEIARQTRLLQPLRRAARGDTPRPLAWDAALDLAADKFTQVVRDHGRTACAEQVADRAVWGAHRQAAAFFREEQGSVGGKGEVPGIVQVGEDDRALDAQISRLGRPGRRGEDQDRGQQQDRGEQEQGGCGCSMHGVLLGAGPGHEAACPAAPPIGDGAIVPHSRKTERTNEPPAGTAHWCVAEKRPPVRISRAD